MKRVASFLLVLLLLISICPVYADDIAIYVNGKYLYCDVAPIIVEGRTLVPLRVIFEELGAWVDWNDDTQTVTAGKDGITLSLQIGSNNLYINGSYITLDVPAQILNDRTLVPVRAVAECFGADVSWDEDTSTVNIYLSSNYDNDYDNDDNEDVPNDVPYQDSEYYDSSYEKGDDENYDTTKE